MAQRRVESLLEASANTAVGILFDLAVIGVCSLLGLELLSILGIAWLLSVGKNYLVRRIGVSKEKT